MDEHYWMTNHGCIMVVGCNLSGDMREGLPMGCTS